MKTLITGVVTFSLLGLSAPAVIASTPEPNCSIQDVQCYKDFGYESLLNLNQSGELEKLLQK